MKLPKLGDKFTGKVRAVDKMTKTVLIRYEKNKNNNESEKIESEKNEEDEENISFDSSDISWISPPYSKSSLIPKPHLLSSLDYVVKILNIIDDKKEIIDGKIISFDDVDKTVTVKSDRNKKQTLPYDSLDMAWVRASESFYSR